MNELHYAVVVGISRYPGVSNLAAPVQDACDFGDWLVTSGGVPQENLRLLTSPDLGVPFARPFDGRPVKREVDYELDSVNKAARGAIGYDAEKWGRSRLYLYVAGHGIMPNGGETALLLADAESGRYENLELSSYVSWYRKAGLFSEVVVFADCCRNWLPQVPKSIVPFDEPPEPGSRVFSLVGYAASPGDPAYENVEESIAPDERRGYFTTWLLKGLRGAAPVDPGHGCITSTTLARYVSVSVEKDTAGKRFPQQVQMPDEPAHPILFGAPAQSFPVTIHFPAGWNQPVDLLRGNVRERYDAAPAPWTVTLPVGLYAVYLADTWDDASPTSRFTVTGAADVQL